MPKLIHKEISLDEMLEQISHLPAKKQLQIVSKITYNLSQEKPGKSPIQKTQSFSFAKSRKLLSGIKGSLAEDVIAEREER